MVFINYHKMKYRRSAWGYVWMSKMVQLVIQMKIWKFIVHVLHVCVVQGIVLHAAPLLMIDLASSHHLPVY